MSSMCFAPFARSPESKTARPAKIDPQTSQKPSACAVESSIVAVACAAIAAESRRYASSHAAQPSA